MTGIDDRFPGRRNVSAVVVAGGRAGGNSGSWWQAKMENFPSGRVFASRTTHAIDFSTGPDTSRERPSIEVH